MAKKMSKKLVALSSAAISMVYFAGYLLTEPAARDIAAAEAGAVATAKPAVTATPAPQVQAGGRDQRRPDLVPQQPGRPAPNNGLPPTGPPSQLEPRRPGFDGQRPGDGGSAARPPAQTNPSQPPAAGSPPQTNPTQPPAAGRPAQIPTPSPVPVQAAPVAYKDGVYSGHGTSRRGDVDVAITIQNGQITGADITHSTLQYPVSRISRLPGQVVARQSAQIDNVTGSTLSARAFQDAVRLALGQAQA